MLTFTDDFLRFKSKIAVDQDTGCWLWIGKIATNGYGHFWLNGKTVGAHQASWSFHNAGQNDGLHVLHKCDVRCCVNPDHLFLGTHQENMDDMVTKGRAAGNTRIGHLHPMARLDEISISEIRKLSDLGQTNRAIAKCYGISPGYVSLVYRGMRRGRAAC